MVAIAWACGVAPAEASDAACLKQVHTAQERLTAAIRQHGTHSPQADQARAILERVEARRLAPPPVAPPGH